MAADSAIRAFAALALALAVAAQTVRMVGQSHTPWGASLSVPVVIGTGVVLGGAAAIVALIQLSSFVQLSLAADRAFAFTKWGILGPSATIPAELVLSGIAALAGWLFAGGLLDASSVRGATIVPIAAPAYVGVLLGLSWRKLGVIVPGRDARIAPLTAPWLATRRLAPIAKVHLGLGTFISVMDAQGRELPLGELSFGSDAQRIEYVRAVAAACGAQPSGIERIPPSPPISRGPARRPGDPLPLP